MTLEQWMQGMEDIFESSLRQEVSSFRDRMNEKDVGAEQRRWATTCFYAMQDTIDEHILRYMAQDWTEADEDFAREEDQFRTAWRGLEKRYDNYRLTRTTHGRPINCGR